MSARVLITHQSIATEGNGKFEDKFVKTFSKGSGDKEERFASHGRNLTRVNNGGGARKLQEGELSGGKTNVISVTQTVFLFVGEHR